MTRSDTFPNEPPRTGASGSSASTPGVTGRLQDAASRAADSVQEAAAPVVDSASEKAGQVAEQAKDQVTSRLDAGKDFAAESLTGIAQALRKTGQHLREEGAQPMLGQYADSGAEQLERLTGYLRQRDADELIAQVEWYARRNPTTFAAGAFGLGMLAARFFRSSGQRAQAAATQRRPSYGTPSQTMPPRPPLPRTGPPPSTSAGGASSGPGLSSATPARDAGRLTPHPGSLPAAGAPSRPGGPAPSGPASISGSGTASATPERASATGGSAPSAEGAGPGRPQV